MIAIILKVLRQSTRSSTVMTSFAVILAYLSLALSIFVSPSFTVGFLLSEHTISTNQEMDCNYKRGRIIRTTPIRLRQSTRNTPEDLYAAVHRKEYEMKGVRSQHQSTADPVRMAMSYAQETANPMRLARALRRVHDDPFRDNNDEEISEVSEEELARKKRLIENGLQEMTMRRACFCVDIKRKSLSRPGEKPFCRFDNAAMVSEAMVRLGADVVFVNVDYTAYGGDISELKSSVNAVRKASETAAVVMKDIVVDEMQLGLAKEAGCDGILLIASVLGPALDNFLDLATTIGLETIIECHTRNEVQRALNAMATNILVSNYDRVSQKYHPEQAIKLAGLFPGSGGPIICLAGGRIETPDQMKRHLAVGYDGVVVGKAVMGSAKAPEFIRVVRDRSLLPAELSQWGLDEVNFDIDGTPMPADVPTPYDDDVYQ